MTTGKSVSDHAVSAVASRDCAFHRVLFGEDICGNVFDETEATTIALADEALTEQTPENASKRLRDSLISLAKSQNEGLPPISGQANTADPSPAETAAPLSSALLAVTEALNDIKPVARVEGRVATRQSGQHYLLIGQFGQLSDAQKIQTRHARLHTAVRMVLDEGSLLFQVTAGPFTRPDAQEIGAAIATNGNAPEIALLCPDRTTQAPCAEKPDQLAADLR